MNGEKKTQTGQFKKRETFPKPDQKSFRFLVYLALPILILGGAFLALQNRNLADQIKKKDKKIEILSKQITSYKQQIKALEKKNISSKRKVPVDWHTYKSKEYGFRVRYPASLSAKDWAHKTPNFNTLVYIGENKDIGNGPVSVGVEKGETSITEKTTWPYATPKDLKDATVGQRDYEAKTITYQGQLPHSGAGQVNFVKYFVVRNSQVYKISYHKNEGMSEDTFKLILSSFEFIE